MSHTRVTTANTWTHPPTLSNASGVSWGEFIASKNRDSYRIKKYGDLDAPRKIEIFLIDGTSIETISTGREYSDVFSQHEDGVEIGNYIFATKQIKYLKIGPTILEELAEKQ